MASVNFTKLVHSMDSFFLRSLQFNISDTTFRAAIFYCNPNLIYFTNHRSRLPAKCKNNRRYEHILSNYTISTFYFVLYV